MMLNLNIFMSYMYISSGLWMHVVIYNCITELYIISLVRTELEMQLRIQLNSMRDTRIELSPKEFE